MVSVTHFNLKYQFVIRLFTRALVIFGLVRKQLF
ncbi:MAG: hypothetical protein ACJA04_000154 [Cellvibrionaceae bacterium]|jgi:hypothetical protein